MSRRNLPPGTMPGHVCNLLCTDDVHVERVWAEPAATEAAIDVSLRATYGVIIEMVRRVEPVAPGPMPEGQRIVQVTGSRPMDEWEAIQTFGVWWRDNPHFREHHLRRRGPWRFRAKYPGVCARTGRAFRAGTLIVKTADGYAISGD